MKIPLFWNSPKKSNSIPVLGTSQIVHSQNGVKQAASKVMSEANSTLPPSQSRDSQYETINELKKTVLKQTILINKNTKSSEMLMAVSFAVGGILSGTGVGIQGQLAPESWIQSSMSFLANKVSNDKTGFEIIQEWQANILLIKKQDLAFKDQAVATARIQEIVKLQEELIVLQKTMMTGFQEQLAMAEAEKTMCRRTPQNAPVLIGTVPAKGGDMPEIKSVSHPTANVLATASVLKNEILAELNDKNLVIKVQENAEKHIHVFLEYKGRVSLGFYAEMPQFRNRLTKWGMKQWVHDAIGQLSMMETVGYLGAERRIWSSSDTAVLMKSKMMYNGSIEVEISDTFLKRIKKFAIDPKTDKEADVAKKIDAILAGFLE